MYAFVGVVAAAGISQSVRFHQQLCRRTGEEGPRRMQSTGSKPKPGSHMAISFRRYFEYIYDIE